VRTRVADGNRPAIALGKSGKCIGRFAEDFGKPVLKEALRSAGLVRKPSAPEDMFTRRGRPIIGLNAARSVTALTTNRLG
jgi:hypothetical protein